MIKSAPYLVSCISFGVNRIHDALNSILKILYCLQETTMMLIIDDGYINLLIHWAGHRCNMACVSRFYSYIYYGFCSIQIREFVPFNRVFLYSIRLSCRQLAFVVDWLVDTILICGQFAVFLPLTYFSNSNTIICMNRALVISRRVTKTSYN